MGPKAWKPPLIWRLLFASALVLVLLYRPLAANLGSLAWLKAAYRSGVALIPHAALGQALAQWRTGSPSAFFQRGAIAWEQGDRDQALDHWQRGADVTRLALYIRGQSNATALCDALCGSVVGAEALYECGVVLAQAGDDRRAIKLLTQVIASGSQERFVLRPDTIPVPYAHAEIGKAYYRLDDPMQALDHLLLAERMLGDQSKRPPSPLLTSIGMIYSEQGQYDRAISYLVRAPEDFYANLALGKISVSRHDWPTATAAYQQASRLRPSDPRPHVGLANTYQGAGMLPEAQAARQQAAKLARDKGQ